ncbi:MAG TPA: gamma-glutamylcyclotransferase, partial [Solirubrobacteraceae bacterium]|nr:gamma-glutamylcyclotransferase [Solirubrobacteraceae bacterium]
RGHRLAFTRRSLRTRCGVADIVTAANESVWGALYELDDEQVAAIELKEGAGSAYERRTVRVCVGAGASEHEAHAYAVIAPDAAHVPPSAVYLEGILVAARARGLPGEYVATLTALGDPAH